MKTSLKAFLFAFSILLIIPLPQEVRLGNAYKLVYFHVPVTAVTIFSAMVLPLFHHKLELEAVKSLSISSTIFAALHLVISAFFMQVAWGGVIISEPKFTFSLILLIFLFIHTLLCFLDRKIARAYSFLSPAFIAYFYYLTTLAEFQLHPERVAMPLLFYLPYFFTFPLVIAIYVDLARAIKKLYEPQRAFSLKFKEKLL